MEKPTEIKLSADELRARLSGEQGQGYWKSLNQLSETPEFQQWIDDEFPNRSSLVGIDRRDFLKFMGASMVLAGLTLSGCRNLPQEKIVPFVHAPEERLPGQSLMYATAYTMGGYATGVLVESHEGRPTKVEGNDLHPGSLGATDVFAQASVLGMYDPDRMRVVLQDGDPSSWPEFFKAASAALKTDGTGFRILTGAINSPIVASQLGQLLKKYPNSKWHRFESVNRDNVVQGATAVFGKRVEPIYDFTKAKVVVSLDADFLTSMPGSVRYARDFMNGRRVTKPGDSMNRLYAIQSAPSLTGAIADHCDSVKPSEVENVARAIAAKLGVSTTAGKVPVSDKWIDTVVKDLSENRGGAVVLAGDHQSEAVHVLCHLINDKIGAIGQTVNIIPAIEPDMGTSPDTIQSLTKDMLAGQVTALLIVGGNPVYDAPADVPFAEALSKVKFTARHGLYSDETGTKCLWQLPATYFLEAWGDAQAYDGTVSIVQPLIAPLYTGKSELEILTNFVGDMRSGYEILKGSYQAKTTGNFESVWQEALNRGIWENSAPKPEVLPVNASSAANLAAPTSRGTEIIFLPDACLYDGRFANNGWLQELPKPLTKLTWDNTAQMSPKMAEGLKVDEGDVVEITVGGKSVKAPVWVMPGHAEDCVTVHLGFGRTKAGMVGNEVGFNAGLLRTSAGMNFVGGADVKKTGDRYDLAHTQDHNSMDDGLHMRDIIRSITLAEFPKNPNMKPEGHEEEKEITMYDDSQHQYDGPQWGLSVDLNTCIGCNACVVACQAENNIPVVGKEQIIKGREMHWIRIDRYYGPRNGQGSLDNPTIMFQPMMCQHCENAPCEPVCPVAATVHSHEGLNQMVYNRCVGTRYCSNNCPYKVRRFNFLNYQFNQPTFKDKDIPLLKMLNNPEVTVRSRGVMEKCTYCVQRINRVRIESKKQNRDIRDGEIVTACEQACPTQSIVFGNIRDQKSKVYAAKNNDPRNYGVLTDLNTRPRTTYLGRVRNPHKDLEA